MQNVAFICFQTEAPFVAAADKCQILQVLETAVAKRLQFGAFLFCCSSARLLAGASLR